MSVAGATPAERSAVFREYAAEAEHRALEEGRDLEYEAEQAGIVPVRLDLDALRNPPREQFLIGRMFPLGKPSVFFGPQGKGKSAVLAQLAFSLAAGAESLWGLPLLPGGCPVLVYTAEDTKEDWERKGGAILQAGGVDMERALERFHLVDRTEKIVRLTESVTIRLADVSRRVVRPTDELEHVIAIARALRVRAVFLETVSNLVDDEDNPTLSTLMNALRRGATATGAAWAASHHATKAASKDNDSGIESARGGGSLIANARNAVSLFPAEAEDAAPYQDRFAQEDLFTLRHGKPTSSTRAHAPLVLVRTDATYGAVFRRPDEVDASPEQQAALAARLEATRDREVQALGRLYAVVADLLPLGPVSPSRLRDHVNAIGVPKRRLDALVTKALDLGFLRPVSSPSGGRGVRLGLGHDPRQPIAERDDRGTTE